MPSINLNLLENAVKKIKTRQVKFEMEPLDIDLAQMQLNLINRLEREIPQHGDFAPVVEKLSNPDRLMNISEVKTICKNSANKTPKQKLRVLELEVTDRSGKTYVYTLNEGEKQEILNAVKDKNFLFTSKSVAISVSAGIS